MKIKRERQVRLDELLKYVWDNDIKNESFFTKESEGYISVDSDGDFCMYGRPHVNKDERFTITEEVEITDESILSNVLCFDCNIPTHYENKRLGLLKEYFDRIYLLNEDETQYNLIYDKEKDT